MYGIEGEEFYILHVLKYKCHVCGMLLNHYSNYTGFGHTHDNVWEFVIVQWLLVAERNNMKITFTYVVVIFHH